MTLELIAERDIWKERAEKAEGELQRYKQAEANGGPVLFDAAALERAFKVLNEEIGCLYPFFSIPHEFTDCRKSCFMCIVDGLRSKTEAALKAQTMGAPFDEPAGVMKEE